MTDKFQIKRFFPNYFAFMINGSVALVLGAILPYIIEQANINLATAGSLLSVFAIGNFAASFIYPSLTKLFGRKNAFIFTICFQPLCLILITLFPTVPVLLLTFVILGIARGSSSVFNNAYINENSEGSAAALNILHMIFAIGAFSSPLLLTAVVSAGYSWKHCIWILTLGSIISIVLLSQLKIKDFRKNSSSIENPKSQSKDANGNSKSQNRSFWKSPLFYICGLLLFFYLGFENCINGWFVTYFKSTGIMKGAFANGLVSFTWLSILFGRLTTAILSTKFSKKTIILTDCIAGAFFFFLMTATQNLTVIGFSIVGLGFFLAGIYPTVVSAASPAINGSDLGMSMLLAISAFGGIITPQIIGSIGDRIGLIGAIGLLVINLSAMILFALLYALKKDKKLS
ncbi:MFS transporter [Treponema pectinovorum]|uniref:MFS transporter n=1 Tax=Treponema pectinovorum TaxID=164 RepID=UPI0011CA3425|nr:MFS transporter [Treponema pectinovorum]